MAKEVEWYGDSRDDIRIDAKNLLEAEDGYCAKCGHYNEVHYNATECECACHER